ncbi:MAG: hypothetical protein EAZ85_07410 [Bacteroidetes bacterium]|nr:MAG: hypothetical protein EAZ85_07410 [Bacteroidota bacterium]
MNNHNKIFNTNFKKSLEADLTEQNFSSLFRSLKYFASSDNSDVLKLLQEKILACENIYQSTLKQEFSNIRHETENQIKIITEETIKLLDKNIETIENYERKKIPQKKGNFLGGFFLIFLFVGITLFLYQSHVEKNACNEIIQKTKIKELVVEKKNNLVAIQKKSQQNKDNSKVVTQVLDYALNLQALERVSKQDSTCKSASQINEYLFIMAKIENQSLAKNF